MDICLCEQKKLQIHVADTLHNRSKFSHLHDSFEYFAFKLLESPFDLCLGPQESDPRTGPIQTGLALFGVPNLGPLDRFWQADDPKHGRVSRGSEIGARPS